MIPSRGPGKPPNVCKDTIKKAVLSHKTAILINETKIAPATAEVWVNLSIELGIKSTSIHSYVVNNRYGLRQILLSEELNDSFENSIIHTTASSIETSSTTAETSLDCLDYFTFAIPKTEFVELLTEVVHSSTTKKGKKIKRIRTVLRPKVWAEKISAYLWNTLQLKHGFHFANHHMTRSAKSGNIKGSCKCGAEMKCTIDNASDNLNTKFECRLVRPGKGKDCGKRQLRGVQRQQIAAELCHKSVDLFRAEQRRALQRHGDPDPPLLYSDPVLRTAKHQYIASQYLHKDPIEALKIMKRTAVGRNIIQSIGEDPFFIHIFSNHQIRLWNRYSEQVPLIIDSTSGIATKILHVPGEKSHSLFLHLAVINCELGQFSVFEAITERQDSVTIEHWLKRIIQSSANYPKQVICDSSRALLTACISAFTNFLTIEEYCDAFKTNSSSMQDKTLVSIDVAHYIKLWADFLKTNNRRIKVFYLACIGQLILSRSEEDAKDMIIMLLTIALSETDGKLIGGNRVTLCEKYKNHLKGIITGQLPEYESICDEVEAEGKSDEYESNEDSDDKDNNVVEDGRTLTRRVKRKKNQNSKQYSKKKSVHSNLWEKWGIHIELGVKTKIKNEIGDRDNAHFDPRIAQRLIKEIRHLPMWSILYNTKFNIDNIRPSSSAAVECEIKKIKHSVLAKKGKYSRVDATVEKLIKYYDGKLRILPAAVSDEIEIEATQNEMEVSELLEEVDKPGLLEIKNGDDTTSTINNTGEFGDKSDYLNDSKQPSLHNEESPSHYKESPVYTNESAMNDQILPLKELDDNIQKCSACMRGDQPEGAHSCRICTKKIHALPGCSMASEDEEGYGQRRLCMNCYNSKNIDYKVALTEIENHKGLALKDLKKGNEKIKRRNRYLGQSKDKISDMLLYESNDKENLPILKNGNSMKLNLVSINGVKYSFRNTCALDSFYQIILAGAINYVYFKEYVQETVQNNRLFEIVSDTLQKGIGANTYRLRGRLLLDYKGIELHQKTIQIIQCDSAVNDFVNYVLQNQPSIEQKIKCVNGCEEIINKESSAILQITQLKNNKKFFDTIRRNMTRKRTCVKCKAEANIEVTTGEAQQYFRVTPRNSSVLEGGEVVIPCEVGNRVGTVQWVKDGFAYVIEPNGEIVGHPRFRMVGDQNAGVYNLRITGASLTDDGEYQCQVGPYLRTHKAIRANAHLDVISPPVKVEISNHPNQAKIEAKVGQSHVLQCSVRFAKPAATIVWYRGNVQIKGGDTEVEPISTTEDDKEMTKPKESRKELLKYDTHGSITIVPTADDDETDYTCEARHPAIPVDMPMRATIKLSVLYPPGLPYIEGYTEGETVRRGQQVDLVCRSRGGNPPAQVVWFKNDEQITNVYRTEATFSENVLSFEAAATDNKARFRCEVSNIMSVAPLKAHVDLTVYFAPTEATITGPTEAKAGEKVRITCTTENSNPPADIKWVVAGRNFRNATVRTNLALQGGWITTSNITFNINPEVRSIVVLCHALNIKLAENVVGTHTINVIYPPSDLVITGYEEGANIDAGSVLKLSCTATAGNPLATLTWYKNDKKVNGNVRTRDHVVTSELAILVNASDNNARIRCEATNSAVDIPLIQPLQLKVNFPPDQVKITRDPKEFRSGQIGRIICESSSSNPPAEMTWWKQGIPVAETRNTTKPGLHGGFVSSVELTLELNEKMNGEVYTCQARNAALERAIHDATTLTILYKPIFSPLDPTELVGMEGEPFVISVSAAAHPTAITYTWTRFGLPLSTGNKRVSAREATLNITKLDRHDAGTYICEAINTEGTSYYQLNLTVQFPAKIERTSKSGAVHSSDGDAKLWCEVDGSPIGDSYVTWRRVGSNSDLGRRFQTSFINKTSFLQISNPSREDVGEYQCTVNNLISNVTSKPILFITNFEPEMDNSQLTKKAAANKGANVRMSCKAQGSPIPKFTWFFKGRQLMPNRTDHKYDIVQTELTELSSESAMTIYRVSSDDYGKYECRAKNKVGISSDEVFLNVTSPPDQPLDLKVYNVTHDSVVLVWKRGFDGGLPTSHQIRWRPALDYEDRYQYVDASPGQNNVVITGLTLGTFYVFSIKAINAKGQSPFLPDLVKVQTLRPNSTQEYSVDVIMDKREFPMNYIYAVAATSIVFFLVNLFIMLWYIVRKRNKARINKSQTADMYAPSTVNGDTMTGELSSVSDEKSDVNFDANDYVDEGRKTAASTYLIDQSIQDFGKNSLEMQVHHHQGTLGRRSNHSHGIMDMDSPPQRTTASGTLSVSKSSYIGNPSPAPPADVSFYSVEMDNGRYLGYEGNPSPAPVTGDPGLGSYYPSMGTIGHHAPHVLGGGGTLTRNRTLPRPVPPPDVTVMTAGAKSPIPPSVPPPPATFARAAPAPAHSHGHPLSTFTSTPAYSDIDGHLV